MVRKISPLKITRRGLILGSVALAVDFTIPKNACDCHTHIIGDPAKFPFFAGRTYTPDVALPEEMAALHRALHIERVVIVTPSVYGTDNSATLWGMRARGANARGVAVIDARTSDAELDTMAAAGVRGIRLNFSTAGQPDLAAARARFTAAVRRLKSRNWHLQMFVSAKMIAALKDVLADSPVPLVFDHFGGVQASLGLSQPGFSELVKLVQSGKACVKLSGAYRASTEGPDYQDVVPFAKAFIAANPDRVLWGTDWPHPDTSTGKRLPIDDARLLNQLAIWAPEAKVRQKILVDNPARLYGF